MIARVRLVLLLAGCWFLAAQTAWSQEWTRFRGPNGQGVSEAKTIPFRWTEADYNWKTPLPGLGHSSPVVWGGRVFTLSADPDTATRYVVCVDAATGRRLWTREYASRPHKLHRYNSYASSTPAVDAQRVYVAWSCPEETTLLALDHDGRDVWRLDLGPWVGMHGFGVSPMLYKDMVILSNSLQGEKLAPGRKPGESFVAAFDRATGEQRWRTPRTSKTVCYSTPCVYEPPGGGPAELICCNTGDGVFSLDPETGRENWSIDVFRMRVVSSPLIAAGLIFGSTGSGGGGNYVVAVRPGPNPETAYTIRSQAPYVPTSVARGDLVFLWYDKGAVTCLDGPTGDVIWRQRVLGNYFSSPIIVGDKLYNISDEGDVVVLAAERQYRLLARNPLGEPTRATPAVAGGRIYFRTLSHLISLGGPAS